MAHTFDELVERQQAAIAAHHEVLRLRDTYGPPAVEGWSEAQARTYETAWRAWRDLARLVQAAVTEYAKDEGLSRSDVDADVKAKAGGGAS
ncbi:hypothetical protein [Streptomyces sp. NPDC046821]|uniref:hypothetical protein n=1 Tax=Streptomyces sp. NPDC046821 TaxID=3154702 RepID=UPI0033E89D02